MATLPGKNAVTPGEDAATSGKKAATILASVLLASAGQYPGGNLSLDEAYQFYKQAQGAIEWMENSQARRRFLGILEYALRAQAPGAPFVITQVIRQALSNGLSYVYSKTSPEASQVYQWAKAVSKEACRLKGLIRLTPSREKGQPVLIGRVPMRYDLVDVVLAHFSRRFPGYRIILDTGRGVFEWDGGIKPAERKLCFNHAHDAHDIHREDYFTSLWEAYYDSQIIEGRLDIARAKRVLPKRYWRWVREGQKLQSYERISKKR
ncbi:MAG: DUF4130 domain-containing protein [Syntrophothermus sp.]